LESGENGAFGKGNVESVAIDWKTAFGVDIRLATGKVGRTWLTEAKNGENGAFGKGNVESVGIG